MISVCIATYNAEKYLLPQVDSILKQIGEKDEIVVSDDGSTDRTLEVLKKYGDKRIKIFINSHVNTTLKGVRLKNYRIIKNFENSISHANGDYIFLSDQDDIWMPNKVQVIMRYLMSDYDLVYSNGAICNSSGQIVRDYFFSSKPSMSIIGNIFHNSFWGATMAFRKDVVKFFIPFPRRIPMHDQWIGLMARYYCSVFFIDQNLILYRRHDDNASFCGEKSQNRIWVKMYFRICVILNLFVKILKNYMWR